MREIKFRAWDKGKGVMIYSDSEDNQFLIDLDGNVNGYDDDDGGKSGMWEHSYKVDVILLQFTGLKDKNGKEIFEGDILAPMPSDYKDQYKGNWQVIFEGGAYFGIDGDGHHITWLPYWTEEQFEVIGNIYENPELLK